MRSAVLVLVLAFAACAGDGPSALGTAIPTVIHATVNENIHNALSVVVRAQIQNADTVFVRFGKSDSEMTGVTPAFAITGDSIVIPVLGLQAETAYRLQVVGRRKERTAAGPVMSFSTSSLPADLPRYRTSGENPSPGFVAFATGFYAIVIDNTGAVVWYRRLPNGAGLNFQPHTGGYLLRPPSEALERTPWMELDFLGNITRTFGCIGGLTARFHDLIVLPDGSYWIMCDELRIMNLTHLGGVLDARVTGTVVQHVSAAGTLLLEWNPFDHFDITDLKLADRTGTVVNWTHGNALAIDQHGDIIVSFRSLNEITRIDARTGEVAWRMGGLRNQFMFIDSTGLPFARQHSARVRDGQLLLLDNSGDPAASRVEIYSYDELKLSARLVASLGSQPPVIAENGGTVQDLPNGHVLVSFGSGERVEEYDAAGNVVWRIHQPGYVFRAHRINSLYPPGAGLPR